MAQADPLLLLPGMMCDARLYFPQLQELGAHRALMVAPLTGCDSIEGLARNLLRVAPARFARAGLSMGGIVAMEMLRLAPERVSRLALLDTNPLAESEDRAAQREPQIARVQQGGLRQVMREEMKPNYLTDGPNVGALLDLCMAMAESLGPEVFATQSRALARRRDQCDTLRAVTVPTLILCGEDDALCPVERHELMRDLIPRASLSIIEGAGHLPTLEQPQATTQALAAWLAA